MPPSLEELHHRLQKRGTETPEQIEFRLANAAHAQPKGDIAQNIQMRKQRLGLKDDAHIAPMRGKSCDVLAIHLHATR